MPFDNSQTDARKTLAEELAIVDGALGLLAEPRDWCQFKLFEKSDDGHVSHCLIGALNAAHRGNAYMTSESPAYHNVIAAVASAILGSRAEPVFQLRGGTNYLVHIAGYNNLSTTTHADVVATLSRVRRDLEAAS